MAVSVAPAAIAAAAAPSALRTLCKPSSCNSIAALPAGLCNSNRMPLAVRSIVRALNHRSCCLNQTSAHGANPRAHATDFHIRYRH